jgi:hypothetical protein
VTVEVRVGLNSGEVVVCAIGSDLRMDYSAVGQTTHLAARMEQLASPGTTLLTADTLRLAEGYVEVTPLGAMPVKGLPAPVETYQLTGAGPRRSRLSAAAARGLTRFVGRDVELEQLREALGRAAEGHGQVVAIVGEPGVGKSRLVWEVTHSHRTHGWLILEAASVSYGKATPYLPVVSLLHGYFQVGDRDEPRTIREKVTGKLLTLDRALEPALPAFLALLDVPVEDRRWEALDPASRAPSPPTCPSSNPQSTNSSSTSRPRRPWASPSRPRCSRGRMRSLSSKVPARRWLIVVADDQATLRKVFNSPSRMIPASRWCWTDGAPNPRSRLMKFPRSGGFPYHTSKT